MDLALVGDHVPRAVGPLSEVGHPRVAVDLGAALAGAHGVGVGDAARVEVALDGVVERSDEVLLLEQWEHRFGLGRGDDLQVHSEVAPACLGHAQPVEALAVVGEHQPARQVDRAVLAGARLDRAVQLDRVLLQLGHVGVAVERVHPAGGVPRRAGGELLALDEHDVGPPGLGEVVQHRRADDATPDDDCLCGGLHRGCTLEIRRHAALGDAAGDELVELLADGSVHRRRLVGGEDRRGRGRWRGPPPRAGRLLPTSRSCASPTPSAGGTRCGTAAGCARRRRSARPDRPHGWRRAPVCRRRRRSGRAAQRPSPAGRRRARTWRATPAVHPPSTRRRASGS